MGRKKQNFLDMKKEQDTGGKEKKKKGNKTNHYLLLKAVNISRQRHS